MSVVIIYKVLTDERFLFSFFINYQKSKFRTYGIYHQYKFKSNSESRTEP